MFSFNEFRDTQGAGFKKFSFLSKLKQQWNKIHDDNKSFRYNISKLKEKKVDGYLLQLNPDRGSNRRDPEAIDYICQPFSEQKFNFTKTSENEIVMQLKDDGCEDCIHTILVNVSPISQYHSLLCPSMESMLPQIATEESITLAMKLMFIAEDRSFRIGFNSLCAMASVNHLHYHLFIEEHELPVEAARCHHVSTQSQVYHLLDYPAPAFCFNVFHYSETPRVAKAVHKLLQYLISKEIAHNIFMTRGTDLMMGNEEAIRVLVWPRKSSAGAKQLQSFNVAVCELSGWFPVYDKDAFDKLQKEDLENELHKWTVDDFEELVNEIKNLFESYLMF